MSGTRTPRLSITIAGLSSLFGDDLARIVDVARLADEAGLDQIVLPDHLAIGSRTDRYPYGRMPLPDDEPWLEPLTVLAAMSAVTSRVRLATGILVSPLRRPLVLAKTAATLDVLSRGRLDLGVGAGWQAEEFGAAGIPFEERWSRLDDGLRACRALWSEAPVSFSSPSLSFEDVRCLPHPVQAGGIPLWFGVAPTPRNARRIAEFGVGWLPMTSDPEEIRAGRSAVAEGFAAAGRDPDSVQVRANAPLVRNTAGRPDLDATLGGLAEFAAAGVDVAAFALPAFVRTFEDIGPFFEQLGAWTRSHR
jgi:probable F420-dependent oxidoreductase